MAALVFYAQVAPAWWPWQAVSLSNGRIPRVDAEKPAFFVDNGAFMGYSVDPGLWYSRLIAFVDSVLRRHPGSTVLVVLPDVLDDGVATLRLARHPGARALCARSPRVRCAAVAHAVRGDVAGRRRVADELASMDHVSALAAPLKANCRRRRRRGGAPDRRCQLEVARTVCGVAAIHGLPCHLLAPRLDAALAELARLPGVASFDSAAWIRPRSGGRGFSPAYGFGKRGAERRFLEKLARLLAYGVPLRLPPGLPVHGSPLLEVGQ